MSTPQMLIKDLTFPDFQLNLDYLEGLIKSPLLSKLQEKSPSLLNVLRRRAGEEERLSKDGAAKKDNLLSKLLAKLVAGIAVVWQFYVQ